MERGWKERRLKFHYNAIAASLRHQVHLKGRETD